MYAPVTTSFETIVLERAGSVVYLTMDRPRAKNALNLRMVQEIQEMFASIREDRTIRCVVMQGAGGTFSAGADIKEMRDPAHQTAEAQLAYANALEEMLRSVQYAPQVTVAAIDGVAMGGGLGLVCVSDVAIASEHSVFALPEARLGIAPAVISSYLVDRVGLSQARRLALSGRRINGYQAQSIGLVHELASGGSLDQMVDSYVSDVLHGSPEALATTKSLLFQVAGNSPGESRDLRVATLNRLRDSAEAREGMAAFVEKRKPFWVEAEEKIRW
jgi:isohexenylglutaconyl-CoA hydratase